VFTTLAIVLLLAVAGPGQAALSPQLAPLAFLVGEWVTPAGEAGGSAGTATFAAGLQGRVLVRTSYAEYPATSSRPASRHDDLLIVYAAENGALRADYYDNEGHVIRYAVQAPSPGQALFVSDASPGNPRYRLQYVLAPGGVLHGRFEIAPPGKPEAFSPYLVWESRRTAPGAAR